MTAIAVPAVQAPPAGAEVHVHCLAFLPHVAEVGELASWLGEEERARAVGFQRPADRERFVLSHGWARAVLASYLGIEPRAVRLGAAPDGRPLVEGLAGFSLAHCATHAALAVAATRWVGVDIEGQRPEIDALAIARRHFAPEESAVLGALPLVELPPAFDRLWTCKEAFVKAIGLGLRCPLDSFLVTGWAVDQPRLGRLDPRHGSPAEWSLRTWREATGCHVAVAVRRPGAVVRRFGGDV